MTQEMLIDIMQEGFQTGLLVAAPCLLAALGTGLMVAIFQAVTSIQEQTLVLVPKMVMVIISVIIFFSWMLNTIVSFTHTMIANIPDFIK